MPSKARVLDTFLIIAVTCSVGIAGLSYFRPLQSAGPSLPPPDASPLLGKALPQMPVLMADGRTKEYTLAATGRPTLLIVFRSTCPACERNAATWKELGVAAQGKAGVVALNLEGPDVAEAWLRRQGILPDELLLPTAPDQYVAAWSIGAVPLTIVTDGANIVRFAHVGVLSATQVAAARAALFPS
jgi:hypothetical protein